MQRPGSHARVLDAFRDGLIHILLGTQMIAKGLDFPNVTLVGVINADVGLHVPDFRAAERTFQLLSQVAGRTGRGPRGGRVLVQTFTPDHPARRAGGDARLSATSWRARWRTRRQHNYPPFQRLIASDRARQGSGGDGRVRRADGGPASDRPWRRCKTAAISRCEVRLLGPAEAPVFRLKGYYRFHFQLQSASAAQLHQLMRA